MLEALPLARYTVLDLTIARAGPTAVRLLADWGANVIKIEAPPNRDPAGRSGAGGRHGPDEQNLHRNKRGLALDLKHPDGHRVFLDLVGRADIVVENFRADVKRRLGIEYETLANTNPRIILASNSGFGQDGPYRDRPGVDQIIQGMSGLMSVTGEPGRGPMRVGVAISDTAAGMFLGQGILLALLHREQTGRGQWVHTSLLESMLCKLDFQAARYTMTGDVPGQEGNHHPTAVPTGAFESSDGLVNIAASRNRMWVSLCTALDAQNLLANQDYADARSRAMHRERLRADLGEVVRCFTTADLVEKLNAVGVPCGPINTIGEAFEDPQVKHLQMTRTAPHPKLGDVRLVRSPFTLSAVPHAAAFHHAAPDVGQHTDEILCEFGYDNVQIQELREAGAIA